MTNYIARHEDKLGIDLSGNDGDSNRTYSLAYANSTISLFSIIVQGTALQYPTGFTKTGSVITFIGATFNTDVITIDYLTTTSVSTSGNLKYSSTQQLAAVLNVLKNIPDWDVGTTPVYENVGTGNNSDTVFYLDHRFIISGSYVLYKGTTQANMTALTETTHYSLDLDNGKITLTAAGVTLLATNNIYTEYSYVTSNIKDNYLQQILLRAEQEVDNFTNTSFTDGTQSNPDYPSIINEYMPSKGAFNKAYYTWRRPVIDLTSALASDVVIGATSLTLTSGTGSLFPTHGIIQIGSEIISYTGVTTDTLTGLTRGIYSSSASAHNSGDLVHTSTVQISGTDEGGVPTWYTLTRDSEVSIHDDGQIYIYNETLYSNVTTGNNLLYKQDVPNRLRTNYLYGWNTVPTDITRLTLILAQKMLWSDNIMSSVIKGRNEFRPEIQDVIQREIDLLVGVYQNLDISNT